MASVKMRIIPDTLRTRAASTFNGTYLTLGTALTRSTRIMKIYNGTNVGVTISWDGTNAHEFLPAAAFLLIDVSANREGTNNMLEIPVGTQIYVNATVGTGTIYLSTYYAR